MALGKQIDALNWWEAQAMPADLYERVRHCREAYARAVREYPPGHDDPARVRGAARP